MAKQVKIYKAGVLVYPQTITDAIVYSNGTNTLIKTQPEKLTTVIDEISKNVSSLIDDNNVSGISSDDKVLGLNNKKLSSTISLTYDKSAGKIYLYGKDTTNPISSVDVASLQVSDQFVDTVELITEQEENITTEAPYIKISFKNPTGTSATTKDPIRISVKTIFGNMTAADLKLSSSYTTQTNGVVKGGDTIETAISSVEKLAVDTSTKVNSLTYLEKVNGASNTYVKIDASEKTNHEQTLTPSLTIQSIGGSGSDAKGLAEASDVKTYIDTSINTVNTSTGAAISNVNSSINDINSSISTIKTTYLTATEFSESEVPTYADDLVDVLKNS